MDFRTDFNMAHDIASIKKDPMLLVFLKLRNSYDTLYHACFLKTLEGYEAGLKMRGIL